MQVFAQEVAAGGAPMPVIHCKIGSLDPALGDVEDDAHPVFVVFSRNSLVGVDSVGLHNAVIFGGCLGWLDFRDAHIPRTFH